MPLPLGARESGMTTVISLIIFPLLLSAQIDTAWVRIYNGPQSNNDTPYAIAIDREGNVFVTGSSYSSISNDDYATIKYYPNGDTAWVRRYNGPANGGDFAKVIAVDNTGNVLVSGTSYDTALDNDYATVKYDGNGNMAWVRTYDCAHDQEHVNAIAVDADGNVCITGRSTSPYGFSVDYATIKYYPNGDTAWVRRYNEGGGYAEANAIGVDASGNVYVTGSSGAGNYGTIKYLPDGTMAWVKLYNYEQDYSSIAKYISLDKWGNIYVTGNSFDTLGHDHNVTIKYNPSGDTDWVRIWDGPENNYFFPRGMGVDSAGNVIITGENTQFYEDFVTIKYDTDGNTTWVKNYSGTGDRDFARAIAIDHDGNAYVTGYSMGSNYDFATVKYYPNGTEGWTARYHRITYATPYAIAVDDSYNVYVTGHSWGGWGALNDYTTIKYVQETGIAENNVTADHEALYMIHPNPAREYLTVCMPRTANRAATWIRLYDITGKKLKEIICNAGELKKRISLTGVASGIYFIEIDGMVEQKVIKVK